MSGQGIAGHCRVHTRRRAAGCVLGGGVRPRGGVGAIQAVLADRGIGHTCCARVKCCRVRGTGLCTNCHACCTRGCQRAGE
eukprot:12869463-Alexandrium_andersonii.AAC.1